MQQTPQQHKAILVFQRFEELISKTEIAAPQRTAATPFAVAWTGGKDSTVVLHLWREFLKERALLDTYGLVAVSIDTGVKFPEVTAFRDKLATAWGVQLVIARPVFPMPEEELAQDPAACCAALKIAPLQKALEDMDVGVLFTGLRADEHPSRKERALVEERDAPPHVQCNPILEWSEMDVWSWIMDKGLPYCSLYMQGYRSLGCMPCTTPPGQETNGNERGGRNQAKERQLDLLRSLGYF